ncbi:MAG: hypothetical protein MUD16_01095 [Desulfobacterales bacterium]|jgi:hypothetical protein|nr:hypothetical protein [Desulfobacterales bacterium]
MSLDLDSLTVQVQRNCDISDARHAGVFSVCGLALRLRDLYRWQHALEPWQEGEPGSVLEWIGRRESLWDGLADCDYERLRLGGRALDPFDTDGVNALLAPHGLLYGAGYARGLKPTYFLARIDDRSSVRQFALYYLGKELARDLQTLPALSQGRSILIRRHTARMFFWDQVAYAAPSARRALAVALDACGVGDHRPAGIRAHLDRLLAVQENVLLHHELGELQETGFDRGVWQQMVAAFSGSRVEILARRVKDLLADTSPHGTLCALCRARDIAGLALAVAFADGLAKAFLPEVFSAWEQVVHRQGWSELDAAVEKAHLDLRRLADQAVALFRAAEGRGDPAAAARRLDRLLGAALEPDRPAAG